MIEGSGSIPLTNGSGSGSRRPKNIRIDPDPQHWNLLIHHFEKPDPDPPQDWKAGSGSASKLKFRNCKGSKWRAVDAHDRGVEDRKKEPGRVCKPVVADLHHFDEKQDPTTSKWIIGTGSLSKWKAGAGSATLIHRFQIPRIPKQQMRMEQ